MYSYEEINAYLVKKLESDPNYAGQLSKAFECPGALLDYDFTGFVDTYYYLSYMIPKGRVIYDLGCCTALQAWFFRNHKKYIAVDFEVDEEYALHTPNMEFHKCTIREFIENNRIAERHFAICNYVPPWQDDNMDLVRKHFRNLYVFYPECGDDPEDDFTPTDPLPQSGGEQDEQY